MVTILCEHVTTDQIYNITLRDFQTNSAQRIRGFGSFSVARSGLEMRLGAEIRANQLPGKGLGRKCERPEPGASHGIQLRSMYLGL